MVIEHCICRNRYENRNWPLLSPPEQHVHGCPVREEWLKGEKDKIGLIRQLCERFSPSAIPDLRGRAKKDREYRKAQYPNTPYRPQPVYAVDDAADFIEEIMSIVEPYNHNNMDWSVYDELRTFGQGRP